MFLRAQNIFSSVPTPAINNDRSLIKSMNETLLQNETMQGLKYQINEGCQSVWNITTNSDLSSDYM